MRTGLRMPVRTSIVRRDRRPWPRAPDYDRPVRTEWDAIVVGLGGIGSGAAFWLSERLGHRNGASQDHSRIIRLSYHRPDYVRLAKRAYATWAEVEARAGETIVTVTGGL